MKKISTLLGVFVMALAAQAQLIQPTEGEQKNSPTAVSSHELTRSSINQETGDRGGNSVIFFEDFSAGFDGMNGIGAWTHADNGSTPVYTGGPTSIWMVANANSPAGYYSTNISPLASPTAANGWVIFDADYYQNGGTAAQGGNGNDVEGTLTTPALDLTSRQSVIVEYYQYFRYCCYSASPLTLEVSTDGGATWSVFPGQGTAIESANTLSANPLKTTVDISCAAAGQANVLIRWGYSTDQTDTGYSHYFWGIDDVTIYENAVANDIAVHQVLNGDVFNAWEIRDTPMEQAIPAADGGVLAGVVYRNNGYADQPNTTVTFDILAADQSTVLQTVSQSIGTFSAFGNTAECPSYSYDTLYVSTNWAPSQAGLYYIRATIASDSTDATPADNVLLKSIEFTEYEYGHDEFDSLNVEITPRDADTPGAFDPCGYGNVYFFNNAGSTCYGISAAFGTSSGIDTEFKANLFQMNTGMNTDAVTVAEGTFEMIQYWIDMSANTLIYFPFDAPYAALTGEPYCAAVWNQNESPTQLTILAQDNTDTDNSTYSYEKGGSGDFVWFASQTWTPAVRLVLAEIVDVAEQTNQVLNSFLVTPNPASTEARLNFNLDAPHYIAYEVRDINGRLVAWNNIGLHSAGQNSVALNVSNYAAGQYSVGIVVDGQHMFRQNMVVTK
jgi:hypothetical protein